jgi:DNA-binding MarR family transcriptional regulator
VTPRSRPVEPDGADPVAVACITGLVRAESIVVNALTENLRRHGVTPAGFNVLMILEGDDEPLCPHEIGERRLVTKGTVTGVIDSLVKAGLVERHPHPADRRMQLVAITARGQDVLRALLPEHRRIEEELLSGLSERERATLARLLGKFEDGSNRTC